MYKLGWETVQKLLHSAQTALFCFRNKINKMLQQHLNVRLDNKSFIAPLEA